MAKDSFMNEDAEIQRVIETHTDDGPGDLDAIPEATFESFATEEVEDE